MPLLSKHALISVIVPVFNVQDYLDRCVKSLLTQSYPNIEVILVDDGSYDNSPSICDGYAIADKRVLVVHKKNGGLSSARNAGIDNCHGSYLTFVDSDDYVDKDYVSKLFDALISNKADMAIGGIKRVDGGGNVVDLSQFKKSIVDSFSIFEKSDLDQKDSLYFFVTHSKMYSKESIGGTRFKEGRLHEDEFFANEMYSKHLKVALIPDYIHCYYINNKGIMANKSRYAKFDRFDALYDRYMIIRKTNFANKINIYELCYAYLNNALENGARELYSRKEVVRRIKKLIKMFPFTKNGIHYKMLSSKLLFQK